MLPHLVYVQYSAANRSAIQRRAFRTVRLRVGAKGEGACKQEKRPVSSPRATDVTGKCTDAAGCGQSRGGAVQAACGQQIATQTKQARTANEVQISRTCEKAQAACDSLSNVANKTGTTKTAHHEMSSAVVWILCCCQPRSSTPHPSVCCVLWVC
jgi:hypothetical protein